MRRLRVRAMSKAYSDKGPDLLRTEANAAHQLGDNMGKTGTGWHTRSKGSGSDAAWREWQGPVNKVEALRIARAWRGTAGAKLQIGRKAAGGKIEPKHELLAVNVPHRELSGCKAATERAADLVEAQFGADVTMAGGFVCKRYNGSSDPSVGWSDHAWGDAVDETPNSPVSNDELTDWCARMAGQNLMPMEQVLGSKGGKVGSYYAPRFDTWHAGGPDSHTWHVHLSIQQHFGARPPCA